MENKKMEQRLGYLIQGAIDSRYNARHWFRYLRKEFINGKPCLNKDEISFLLESEHLTMFQKVSLMQAMTEGTPTCNYIAGLNRPAKKRMLKELLRRMKNG